MSTRLPTLDDNTDFLIEVSVRPLVIGLINFVECDLGGHAAGFTLIFHHQDRKTGGSSCRKQEAELCILRQCVLLFAVETLGNGALMHGFFTKICQSSFDLKILKF